MSVPRIEALSVCACRAGALPPLPKPLFRILYLADFQWIQYSILELATSKPARVPGHRRRPRIKVIAVADYDTEWCARSQHEMRELHERPNVVLLVKEFRV